ncbi:MAG: hypothetical protein ACON4Z_08610 [Planctomycetota bacterium]
MRGEPLPIYLFAAATLPGASLWVGARRCLRKLGADGGPAPIFVRRCGPVFLQRATAALFSGRPLVVAGPAPLGAIDRGALATARVWVPAGAGGALQPLEVDDLASVAAAAPEHVDLPAAGWHEPTVLRRVLRSLVTPTHVLVSSARAPGGIV